MRGPGASSYRAGDGSILLEPIPVPDDGGRWLGVACPAGQIVRCPRTQQDLGGSIDAGVLGGDCRGERGHRVGASCLEPGLLPAAPGTGRPRSAPHDAEKLMLL